MNIPTSGFSEGLDHWNAYDLGWDSAATENSINPYMKGTPYWEEWEIGRAEAFAVANTLRVPKIDTPDYTPEIKAIIIGVTIIAIAIGVSVWVILK